MAKYLLTVVLIIILNIFQSSVASEKNENLINHNINSTSLARPVKFMGNDLLYLSELPLEKLLQVKKSLDILKRTSYATYREDNEVEEDLLESRMMSDKPAFTSMFGSKPKKSAMASVDDSKIVRLIRFSAFLTI